MYVHCSTVDVYPNTDSYRQTKESYPIAQAFLNTYGVHKWLVERLAEKYTENFLILRLGTVIGTNLKKGPLFDI